MIILRHNFVFTGFLQNQLGIPNLIEICDVVQKCDLNVPRRKNTSILT